MRVIMSSKHCYKIVTMMVKSHCISVKSGTTTMWFEGRGKVDMSRPFLNLPIKSHNELCSTSVSIPLNNTYILFTATINHSSNRAELSRQGDDFYFQNL